MSNDAMAAVVAEHRDSPTPTLSLEVPLLRFLDVGHCEQLTKKLENVAGEWEVRQATVHLWESLPKEAGLYMFVWRPSFEFRVAHSTHPNTISYILYVGQTGADNSSTTLRDRYKTYTRYLAGDPAKLWEPSEVGTRAAKLGRYLKLRPLEYWFTVVSDSSRLALLEDQLIQLINPPLNVMRTPRLRPKPAGPAFPRAHRSGE